MKLLALATIFCGLAMAVPIADPVVARAVTSVKSSSIVKSSVKASSTVALLAVNVGGSSSPLVGVNVGTATVVAVNMGSSVKASSASIKVSSASIKVSSASIKVSAATSTAILAKTTSKAVSSANVVATTITVAPSSTLADPTALPSTFSAPVQGQGTLSLNNLPAMPAAIDKTFSGLLGSVYGLMSGACNSDYKCSITVAGTIQSLLVDGGNYTASSTISAWCNAGRCYASGDPTVNATSPFTITCNGNNACSATISGAATAIFTNGQQVELWGWLTPAGYCQDGVCTASIKAFGDPMY